ncbi:c2h2 type zinc finger [Fusarium heterosporum]|uniref:C2h2 type zinc finger n=1 Tax=Fusarium heterosporum TaxID=42747 RepID=A0A8H5T0Y0_FUSHE|nr:c2h2 type zinc finger [Fusarium heterosporum]
MKRSREIEQELDSDSEPTQTDPSLRPVPKVAQLDSAIDDAEDTVAMRCNLPPHREPLAFRSYDDYEVHYNKTHTNRCLECRKNFPSEHLLNVHIEEYHDPLVTVKKEQGEHTYSCFVEGCERKCMTHQKRRMHLIDKHMYPKNFFFAVTRDGIDGRRSLLNDSSHHRRRSSTSSQAIKSSRRRASLKEGENVSSQQEPESQVSSNSSTVQKVEPKREQAKPVDTEMADLAGAMSSLSFVPPSVRFGRGRAGFAKN